MIRYMAIIEYCGTKYCGMQKQKNATSVQSVVETALTKFYNQAITIEYCGRTDAGVHAMAQVIHFDAPIVREEYKIAMGVNFYLNKEDVRFLKVQQVDNSFHSRFSAKARKYVYKIMARSQELTFQHNTHWGFMGVIDVEKMRQAASYLIGQHDFSSFRSAKCQAKTPVRTIIDITITKTENLDFGNEFFIFIKAKSFLHSMVRNIVGTLVYVASSDLPVDTAKIIMDSKDCTKVPYRAPPHGLYFLEAEY
jgi:tRNA pseudouridine38-40 synthase